MSKLKVHLVAAARPNFMKIAPLYHEYSNYYTKADKGPKRKRRKKAVKIAPETVKAEEGDTA